EAVGAGGRGGVGGRARCRRARGGHPVPRRRRRDHADRGAGRGDRGAGRRLLRLEAGPQRRRRPGRHRLRLQPGRRAAAVAARRVHPVRRAGRHRGVDRRVLRQRGLGELHRPGGGLHRRPDRRGRALHAGHQRLGPEERRRRRDPLQGGRRAAAADGRRRPGAVGHHRPRGVGTARHRADRLPVTGLGPAAAGPAGPRRRADRGGGHDRAGRRVPAPGRPAAGPGDRPARLPGPGPPGHPDRTRHRHPPRP
ncbi:MAG: hypothetical protein AVDCRST_MAG41-4022, partial [uncultured Corynebacteriales bacterium]